MEDGSKLTMVSAMPIYVKNTYKSSFSAMPIYVKNTYKSSFLESRNWDQALVYSTGIVRAAKFVQMMISAGLLTFLDEDQLCFPICLYGENDKKFIFSKCIVY